MALAMAGESSYNRYSIMVRPSKPAPVKPDTCRLPATMTETAIRLKPAPPTPPDSDFDPSFPRSDSPTQRLPAAVLTPTATPDKKPLTRKRHDSVSLPMQLFPPPLQKFHPPRNILDLTPESLRRLAEGSTIHTIPCTLREFLGWCNQYRDLLESEADKSIFRLWEYDERKQAFIIRCMPSPVHESICQYASWLIPNAVWRCSQLPPMVSGVAVHTNTDIKGLGPTRNSKRCPDLYTKVQSAQPKVFIRGIVIEVGFSQGLDSLRRKATELFQDIPELHMCILIDITEQAQEYTDCFGEKISKSKAKKLRNEWAEWLTRDSEDGDDGDAGGTLTLEEEIVLRMGGRMMETQSQGELVLTRIKEDLTKRLLEQDEEGGLVPSLVEPMDATIYVYARGNSKADAHGQSEAGAHLLTSNVADGGVTEHLDSTDTTDLPISLIFSATFLESSEPISPSPTDLTFTLAELYGPLPRPTPSLIHGASPPLSSIPSSLLSLIPPTMRPHAHETITIQLGVLATLITMSGLQLREDRAVSRAGAIVERDWAKVWERRGKETEANQREERINKRAERLVDRRKRKAQDGEVSAGMQDPEEQSEIGVVGERQRYRK